MKCSRAPSTCRVQCSTERHAIIYPGDTSFVEPRVYNKREEYRTVKMCSESNVILHVWHGIRVTCYCVLGVTRCFDHYLPSREFSRNTDFIPAISYTRHCSSYLISWLSRYFPLTFIPWVFDTLLFYYNYTTG